MPVEKWGIATDRLKKKKNPRSGLLVPAQLALGSFILAVFSCILDSSLTIAALKVNHCFLLSCLAMVTIEH